VLKQHNSPEPEESALYLLSHAIELINGVSSVHNLALQQLTDEQTTLYSSFIERRKKYEPIQYIIGKWDFHQLSGLSIRRPMLCPRPETEELVEILLAEIEELIHKRGKKDKGSNGRIRILDVGAGTGAIGIAIAHQLPHHVQVLALDVLPEAVELSNENAQQFLSKLVDSDVGDVSSSQQYPMNFDLVVSNPPYIPSSDMPSLSTDILDYESVEALCGGDDGLDVIRDIVQRLPKWMPRKDEEKRYCWMEVDDSHPSLLESWLAPGSSESKRWSVEYCERRNDFCGRSRFVKLR
ncbi:hemk-like sam-dependent methylase protein, partial [Thalassiosira pseudonana CCMP1335]